MSVKSRERRKVRDSKTRAKIALSGRCRLSVYKSDKHVYVQLVSTDGSKVFTGLSTLSRKVREKIDDGKLCTKVRLLGKLMGQEIIRRKIGSVGFDRGGYKYHGHVLSIAEAVRAEGVKF